ncbi:MAG: di-trans,poly-cis-decaprenylcistransferase, partial [Deltaproteobacteria bacterium]|nr:di-trans,poly-cis-decaprenylcistransferase [Deltaproteobacteria bacterium]
FLEEDIPLLIKNNIRLKVIGDQSRLNIFLKKKIEQAIKKTQKNTGMILNIALSYGGRQEIMDAVQRISKSGKSVSTEKDFESYLWTSDLPDPDLLIRTSGEKRISNFLLWQCAYSELYFTDVMWPDFSKENFIEAVHSFNERERRYGQIC